MSDNESDKSGGSDDEPKLTEVEIKRLVEEKVYKAFMEFDVDGTGSQIKSDQVKDVLEFMDIQISEQEMFKMITEIDPDNTGYINIELFKNLIGEKEVTRQLGSDESELLDAFVAMGGQPDGEGSVDAAKLIQTIKEEFQMTIDIVKLIAEVDEDGSGEIEFDEFKSLLQSEA